MWSVLYKCQYGTYLLWLIPTADIYCRLGPRAVKKHCVFAYFGWLTNRHAATMLTIWGGFTLYACSVKEHHIICINKMTVNINVSWPGGNMNVVGTEVFFRSRAREVIWESSVSQGIFVSSNMNRGLRFFRPVILFQKVSLCDSVLKWINV